MDTLEEMQYIAVRDEIRNRIAAFYGVSSIFMVDNGKSGGLNNEGLQILVTNRAVEFGQKVYTEVLFPRLLRQMNIHDWKLTLYPNEEEDEITRLRRDEQELNVAQRMAQLGFQLNFWKTHRTVMCGLSTVSHHLLQHHHPAVHLHPVVCRRK